MHYPHVCIFYIHTQVLVDAPAYSQRPTSARGKHAEAERLAREKENALADVCAEGLQLAHAHGAFNVVAGPVDALVWQCLPDCDHDCVVVREIDLFE